MMDVRVLRIRFSEVRLISDGDEIDTVSNFLIELRVFVAVQSSCSCAPNMSGMSWKWYCVAEFAQ